MRLLICVILSLLPSFSWAQKTVLILGDSITEGYGVNKDASYPVKTEELLKKKNIKVKIVSSAISGSTSASALGRLKWAFKNKPDIVILALGANDGLRGIKTDAIKKNLSTAIEYSQKNKVKIIVAGMLLPYNYGDKYRNDFENTFKQVTKKYKTGYIPFLLKGVGGNKELNQSDGIHPNEKGHLVIAKTIATYLEKYL